ncbi:hypothetical protein [Paraburkholderia humisilvae]|uniref:Uncharacterized protein n=1 Tax=Paraburkholderia humisilvae TaxID=627669 RepID=A0A6J5DL41_9BURK|nr:hypothetical protein [Paraburkholderia humisilvae]CAB3754157.1 hypothetical protein LMG29542_02266 [Paraburkholderia humisilvae]
MLPIQHTPFAQAARKAANTSEVTETRPRGMVPTYWDESDVAIARSFMDIIATGHPIHISVPGGGLWFEARHKCVIGKTADAGRLPWPSGLTAS